MFKQEKGVTLVALVITIIVLLILAGVSISLVAGDNGVMSRAQKASVKTKYGTVTEGVGLALADINSEYTEAMADGKVSASGKDAYFTEGKLAKALKDQGLTLVKCKSSTTDGTTKYGKAYTKIEPASSLNATETDATQIDNGLSSYRVYAGESEGDWVEVTFTEVNLGYKAEFFGGELAKHSTNHTVDATLDN